VHFAHQGEEWVLDLSETNAARLSDVLAEYKKAGTPVTRPTAKKASRAANSGSGRTDLAAIRSWAKDNGHKVSDKGRVPGTVVAAFDAAHS
jgi:hypothetical protein